MTEQEIYLKIEVTYNSEKGKGFITHLLRSFFPVDKAYMAFFNEEKREYKCCITGAELGTKEDMFNVVHTEEGQATYMKDFMGYMKAMANQDETYTHSDEFMELKKQIKPVAIVCEKSDKCLSVEAFRALQNFYFTEMLKGNKHINWVANNEQAKEFVKHGKKNGYIKNKKEEKAVHKATEHSGLTLGDLDALKELKARME